MSVRQYLPSKQFSLLTISLFASVALVYGAETLTKAHTNSLAAVSPQDAAAAAAHANWEATLSTIQSQQDSSLPTPPDPNVVDGLRKAAQSSNVTDSVARTLLVNLTNAKAQGLGDDIPTQDKLIKDAVSQIQQTQRTSAYTQSDLRIVDDSKASLHDYGNALAMVIAKNTGNEYANTMIIVDNATSQSDGAQLKKLEPIAALYKTLAAQLLKVPVPQTLAPFHLQLVNNFKNITDSYAAMEGLINDPLQGLAGIQTYQSLTQETLRVFTNIAQALNKDGILFTKDEPGAAWASLLSQ